MLRKLVVFLVELGRRHPLRSLVQWRIVPHVNPDGEAHNAPWQRTLVETTDHRGNSDLAFDLASYLRFAIRELPGDDIEFGFPMDDSDTEARPENAVVAQFLTEGGPYDLHASFHGMALAPGPWFLLEPGWIDRTAALREVLRERVRIMGYSLFDVDRKGEKGFRRIDLGFSTRPDSRAMSVFFEERNGSDFRYRRAAAAPPRVESAAHLLPASRLRVPDPGSGTAPDADTRSDAAAAGLPPRSTEHRGSPLMRSSHITRRAFEELVAQAVDQLPEDFARLLDNVAIVVEEEPSAEELAAVGLDPERDELLGLYRGVPQTERDSLYDSLPDCVVVYRQPILRSAATPQEIIREIRQTVLHELGHHFGLDDEEMPY
jgi:predicted Zn-dependent protease with MMP-like domain